MPTSATLIPDTHLYSRGVCVCIFITRTHTWSAVILCQTMFDDIFLLFFWFPIEQKLIELQPSSVILIIVFNHERST